MQQQGFLYGSWKERLEVYTTPQAVFNALDVNKNQNPHG